MMTDRVAQSEFRSGASGAISTRNRVNWYPKRGVSDPSSPRCPVKYHHSVR